MRRARPSRPNPQSVESTRRSGGTYSSARRISPATNSGGSTAAVEWFTTPMAIFLSVRTLARSGRSRPLVEAHSRVITSAFVWSRYGKDRSYDGRSQCSGCWLGFPQHVWSQISVSTPAISRLTASVKNSRSLSVAVPLAPAM